MGEAERSSRMAGLRRRERRDNIDAWTSSFISAASAARAAFAPLHDADFEGWLGDFLKESVFAPGKTTPWPAFVEAATGEPLAARHFAAELAE